MSVYDRSMFRRGPSMSRGPRISPQDVQRSAQMVEQVAAPMIQRGMAGIARDMQKGIKQAKNYEEAINAFRGDVKPMKARKDELGSIVGPKDAKKTPDSVVALAQPAIQMKVMQGIGSMPQAPVKMQAGGVAKMPTLMELYNKDSNRQLLEQIYPDTSETTRKSALGSLLLGAVAPAALRFASGTPLTEAIEPLPAAFAQAGLQAQQGKQAREQAMREARFKLASDELAAERTRRAQTTKLGEGEILTDYTGRTIATGPKKVRATGNVETYIYTGTEPLQTKFGLLQPNQEIPLGANEFGSMNPAFRNQFKLKTEDKGPGPMQEYVFTGPNKITVQDFEFIPDKRISIGANQYAKLPATVKNLLNVYQKPDKFTSKSLYKLLDDGSYTSTLVTNEDQLKQARNDGFTEDSRPPGKKADDFKFYLNRITGQEVLLGDMQLSNMSEDDRKNLIRVDKQEGRGTLQTVTFRTPQVIAGVLRPAGTPFKMFESEIAELSPEARAQMTDPIKMSDVKVLYKRNEFGGLEAKTVFTPSDFSIAIGEGFTPQTPEKFEFVKMIRIDERGNPVTKVARSFEELNQLLSQEFRTYSEEYKTFGNKLLKITPAGTQVVLTETDPATLFNAQGQARVVKNNEEALAARNEGFHFTDKPEVKGITSARANTMLLELAPKISNGTADAKQIREFQTAVNVIKGQSRVTTAPGGEGLVTQGGQVPPFVVEAIRLAKNLTNIDGYGADFNDMGLLQEDDAGQSIPYDYEGIIDPTYDYAANIGPRAKFGRGVGNVVDFFKALFVGPGYDPLNAENFQGARDLQYLNTITVTRALNAIGGKDTEGLRQRIEALQVDPYSAGLTETKLKSSVENMLAFLRDNKIKLEGQRDDAPTAQIRAKKRADIDEMDYLISQYEILDRNLQSRRSVDPKNAPSLQKKP